MSRSLMLFRFALREGDWRLAAQLAELLARRAPEREEMQRELALAALNARPGAISVAALRTLGRLARILGLRPAA